MINHYYLVIQNIENFLNLLIILILKIKNIFKNNTPYPNINKNNKICLLGNGPSLLDDFELILDEKKKNANIMGVNLFILSDFFHTVKPDYYIIQDPGFFKNNVEERVLKIQKNVVEAFLTKVTWEMKLLLPIIASNNNYFKKIEENKNISVIYRKNFPIIGGSTRFNNFLFRNNLATPLAQNVLIGGLFEILQMGFKDISIFGADHSWHENYILGKDNILYTEDRHFYDSQNVKLKAHVDEYGTPVRVHHEFFNLYRTFKIYDSLAVYARSISAKVVNKSSITWIDSFPRK